MKINERWEIIFDSEVDEEHFFDNSIALEQCNKIPQNIIWHTIENKCTQRLGNAIEEGDFTATPYINEQEIRSILCIPLISIKQLEGVLYLEEPTLKNHFTLEQESILKSLGSILINVLRSSFSKEKIEKEIQYKTEKIAQQNEQILNLNNELTHRYGNNLGRIREYLSSYLLQGKNNEGIAESIARLDAAIKLHNCLNIKDGLRVDMFDYFTDIIYSVFDINGIPTEDAIDLEDFADITFETELAGKLGFIVCELTINACKYAFKEHSTPKFKVSLIQSEDHMHLFRLIVKDNGSGYPAQPFSSIHNGHSNIPRRNDGLHIINNLCKEIIKSKPPIFKNEEGAHFELSFSID